MSNPANLLVMHHHPCQDGFAAAWVVRNALGGATLSTSGKVSDSVKLEFWPATYGEPLPGDDDIEGRDVLMVDFSCSRAEIDRMAKIARTVLVLDHHRSAEKELAGLPEPGHPVGWLNHYRGGPSMEHGAYALFDMHRSGCVLAWDFFNFGRHAPLLLRHIQDRDLWTFRMPGTAEVVAWLFSYPYSFQVFDRLATNFNTERGLRDAISQGEALVRKQAKDIAEFIDKHRTTWKIANHENIPVCNLPYQWASEGAQLLAGDTAPFAVAYYDGPMWRNLSFRSPKVRGADVSEIAKKVGAEFGQGGGGHFHAAGTRVPLIYHGDGTVGTVASSVLPVDD